MVSSFLSSMIKVFELWKLIKFVVQSVIRFVPVEENNKTVESTNVTNYVRPQKNKFSERTVVAYNLSIKHLNDPYCIFSEVGTNLLSSLHRERKGSLHPCQLLIIQFLCFVVLRSKLILSRSCKAISGISKKSR